MSYFDQVNQPINVNRNLQTVVQKEITPFQELLQRIEKRAMDVVCEKQPAVAELAGSNLIIIDPYGDYSPEDTTLWMDIFIKTYQNREFYARLFYIRGGGTKLVVNQRWGYIFQPVIGFNGWSSQEEYNLEKQCLNDYRDDVIKILRELRPIY
jgi:hypothetical protein